MLWGEGGRASLPSLLYAREFDMATRFIHKGLDVERELGDKAQLVFDRNKNLSSRLNNGAGTDETRFVPLSGVEKVTASKTITYSDHGKTFFADSTTSVVLTLPATKAGITFTLVVEQLTDTSGHAFSPAAADQIIGNGFTPADDKDAICSAATDRVGDALTIVGDGELGWYITAVTGTWAREA